MHAASTSHKTSQDASKTLQSRRLHIESVQMYYFAVCHAKGAATGANEDEVQMIRFMGDWNTFPTQNSLTTTKVGPAKCAHEVSIDNRLDRREEQLHKTAPEHHRISSNLTPGDKASLASSLTELIP